MIPPLHRGKAEADQRPSASNPSLAQASAPTLPVRQTMTALGPSGSTYVNSRLLKSAPSAPTTSPSPPARTSTPVRTATHNLYPNLHEQTNVQTRGARPNFSPAYAYAPQRISTSVPPYNRQLLTPQLIPRSRSQHPQELSLKQKRLLVRKKQLLQKFPLRHMRKQDRKQQFEQQRQQQQQSKQHQKQQKQHKQQHQQQQQQQQQQKQQQQQPERRGRERERRPLPPLPRQRSKHVGGNSISPESQVSTP